MFITAGGNKPWQRTTVSLGTCRQSLMDGADNWECTADLKEWRSHMEVISKNDMRPDIALNSKTTKRLIMI